VGHVWDEQQLVRRCKEGSEAAYAELVRLHQPRLYQIAFRLTSDRQVAEDVVQEAFLAAFKAMERFEPKPSLAPWLNTITVRISQRATARRRARPSRSLDLITPGGDGFEHLGHLLDADLSTDPQAIAEAAELRSLLAAAIGDLPFDQRAAVVLRHVAGVDYSTAAETMGVPLNTYKSHLLRGTRALRARLTRQLDARAEASPGPGNGSMPAKETLIGARLDDAPGPAKVSARVES
jgi:RNA polymerase sigma-70 factor (ECF subfamily)